MSDHERGCPGREYTCTCGYDDAQTDRITALIAAGDKLAGFAGHDERCWEPLNPCNCGYTDAWKAWQEVRGDD
jgi:hypothetical protein